MLAHVGQGLGIDHVVAVAGPQHLQEVQPALRAGGGKRGEVIVAELGAEAVLVLVAGAGVVDADPACRRQAGPQHIARLVEEAVLAFRQQPDNLPLGDHDADRPKLRHQTRHGDLALMVLKQHQAAQLRPEMAGDAGRHRCRDGQPVRGQPALAADTDDVRPQHQILDEEVFLAVEVSTRSDGRPDLVGGDHADATARAWSPICFSRAAGAASRKVCIGVLPKQ